MSNEIFGFAFITDAQIGMNSPSGLRGPGSDKERLDSAIKFINENDLDFLVLGGDQIDSRDDENTDAQLDILEESLSALDVPYYGVIGNHEQDNAAQDWKYIQRGLPVRFSMSHKSLYLVGINASWIRGYLGEQCEEQEWSYLVEQLSLAPKNTKHRFVVMHWPLFSNNPHEEETYWNMSNRNKLIEVFKEHDVSCVLCGHWQQDIDACWQGVSLVTSVGTSLYLQYPEELAFKVVTVFDDGWSARRVAVPVI